MAFKVLSVKELSAKKATDLSKYVAEAKLERSKLLQQLQAGKTKQTHKLGELKRSVATALTLSRKLELQANEKEEKN